MLIIRTTDPAHATSGIKELAGQAVYYFEDMECVKARDDFLRLRIPPLTSVQTPNPALLLVDKLNRAVHEKMVRGRFNKGSGLLLMRNIVRADIRLGHAERIPH